MSKECKYCKHWNGENKHMEIALSICRGLHTGRISANSGRRGNEKNCGLPIVSLSNYTIRVRNNQGCCVH